MPIRNPDTFDPFTVPQIDVHAYHAYSLDAGAGTYAGDQEGRWGYETVFGTL